MQYSAGTVAAEDNDAGEIIDKKFENRQEFLDIIKKIVFVYPKLNEYKEQNPLRGKLPTALAR
jgi:hypothetical protein